MKNWLFVVLAIAVVSCGEKNETTNHKIAADPDNGGIILPEGFSALVVAEETGRGRHIAVNTNGDIYVSLRDHSENKGIACLRDTSSDGRADVIEYAGQHTGTGIKLHKGFLYFGSDTAVVRYPLHAGDLLPGNNWEMVARGFPQERQHEAKPMEFDGQGNMYVTVGAPANACMEQMRTKGSPGMDPCPILEYAGGIWKFKDDVVNQDQLTDGERYATGIRHAVANSWNKQVNELYVVQHGRDQLSQFFPEMFDDKQNAELPAEEFFLVTEGADFGWPYCYFDPFQNKKVLAPEYGGDGEMVERCENKMDPIMAFPGHIAPNDLLFYTGDMFPEKYRNGAFIAFHGSWNRAPEPQSGYFVVFVPFDGAYPSGDWEIFADGFAGVETINSTRDAEYRPCGLAQGPDGSLYVVDSNKGKIWRILYS
ncbi:MAG TPA: sorbosone dehydrogenase [Mariniphaga anaerophila]|uniref:Sorbosone dehydrogenase n=1 Tax=Mariniphaga anaerophila TaxID=1484053 RepID=A0A831PR59_9BACT|nr:sorbosone dehydrogenase [Mariniphaga anaerophila]